MRQWAFPFLLGAVVGIVAGVLAFDPEPHPVEIPTPPSSPGPTPGAPRPLDASPPAADASDAALAEALELARFDGNWAQVGAIAKVLRERAPPAAPGVRSGTEARPGLLAIERQGSLLELDQEYRNLLAWLEVRGRDNRATRLLASETDPAELERRLTELFFQSPNGPEDEVVIGDAARLLAWTHREGARRTLLTALQDPSALRVEQAAAALALSGDPEAESALVAAMEGEREVGLRLRVAEALAQGDLQPGRLAVSALARTAKEDRDLEVRARAIAALVRVDLARAAVARDALIAVAESETEQEDLRIAAVRAFKSHYELARDLPLAVVESLERLLGLAIPPLRLEVIQTLGVAGRRESLKLLDDARISAKTADERAALEQAIATLRNRAIPE